MCSTVRKLPGDTVWFAKLYHVGIVMDKIISVIFERMTPWIQINAKRE